MVKKILYFACAIFILSDLTFSFYQYLHQPLEGDIARNLVPEEGVKPVFESPLGFKAIREDIRYSNPNRFFSHWCYREALLRLPRVYQKYTDPITSVYLACATWKVVFQMLLIALLAGLISGSLNIFRMEFILAATLVVPFFQANGYSDYMGIIDPSITYAFFYALPLIFLLIYLTPLIWYKPGRVDGFPNWLLLSVWMPLVFIVCLSGPLNPGILLVLSALFMIHHLVVHVRQKGGEGFMLSTVRAFRSIPRIYLVLLLPASVVSVYSLYLGSYNWESELHPLSLLDLYLKLPEGIYQQFTQKLGFPVLFVMLVVNALLIRRTAGSAAGSRVLSMYKWIGLFSILYILLLPMGGYRVYRPHVLRYDTIMPVTLSLIFLFGLSTVFILKNLPGKYVKMYIPVVLVVLFVFTNADQLEAGKADCEKEALGILSTSPDSVVVLTQNCTVLAWNVFHHPEESRLNGQLLHMWGITKEEKRYVNQ